MVKMLVIEPSCSESSQRRAGMRTLLAALAAGLISVGVLRTAAFLAYTWCVVPSPFQAFHLEGASVHFAWRVQHGLPLYPKGDGYPYAVNFMGPVYFWVVGMIGRLLDADIPELYRIGRLVTFACGLMPVVLAGAYLRRRYGLLAGLAGSAFGLGSAPMLGFAVMTRPDMMAELLGISGFLLCYRRTFGSLFAASVLLGFSCLTKQTAGVYLIAGAIAVLLDGDRKAQAAMLCLLSATVAVSTVALLALGGEPQIVPSLLGQSAIPWDPQQRLAVWMLLAKRSPDLLWFAVVGAGCWVTARFKDRKLLTLAAVLLATAWVACAKKGSDLNYFLGLPLIEMLAAGTLCAAARCSAGRGVALAALLLLSLMILLPGTANAVGAARRAYQEKASLDTPSGAARLRQYRSYQQLAQDPKVRLFTDSDQLAVYQGERAAFLDAYLFRLGVSAGRIDASELVSRVESKSFDFVILSADVSGTYADSFFWRLPDQLASAVSRNYMLVESAAGLFVYVPRL